MLLLFLFLLDHGCSDGIARVGLLALLPQEHLLAGSPRAQALQLGRGAGVWELMPRMQQSYGVRVQHVAPVGGAARGACSKVAAAAIRSSACASRG
jgi:hypothetical protein